MTAGAVFDYDRFKALSRLDLVAYMEPLVLDESTAVKIDDLEELLTRLDDFDEYHLVYALQLVADRCPERIVSKIPIYLGHNQDSVRAATLNILAKLPSECVTRELLDQVKESQRRSSENAVLAVAVRMLEGKLDEKPSASSGR